MLFAIIKPEILIPAITSIVGVVIGVFGNRYFERKKWKDSLKNNEMQKRIDALRLGIESIQKIKDELKNFIAFMEAPTRPDRQGYDTQKLNQIFENFSTQQLEFQEFYRTHTAHLKAEENEMLHRIFGFITEIKYLLNFYQDDYQPHKSGVDGMEGFKKLRESLTEYQNLLKRLRNILIK